MVERLKKKIVINKLNSKLKMIFSGRRCPKPLKEALKEALKEICC